MFTITGADGEACAGMSGFHMTVEACMHKVLIEHQTGSILAGGTENPPDTTGQGGVGNTGTDWANEYNIIQSYAIQHSRLHIPVVFGVDAVHGFGHPWQASLFPQSLGMGATWDTGAALTGGTVTGQATRATGWN
jgi:beta-glucosidase